jgi:acyl-CoA hydrolase
MNIQTSWAHKVISIPEAVGLIGDYQTLCVAMAAAEPVGLLTELGRQVRRMRGVTLWNCLPMREYPFLTEEGLEEHLLVENWFYGATDRRMHCGGRVSYIPNNLSQAAAGRLATCGAPDIYWGTATPPDSRGYMSLSLGLVIEKAMVESAGMVVLEINENLPFTLGDTQVHVSEVDFLVENHGPLFEITPATPDATEEAIGRNIATLIEDGSTLQLGIGGIPNAITACLIDKKDLGIHTEMFNDGMVDLYEAGAVTGRRKTLWKGKMVGAFALGTRKLYDFIDRNLGVEFQQGKITNDPYVMAKNYRMVSVNTALSVDLTGQVCSESIGSRQYSGTGGQLETHRGAQMAEGGKGIIALRSTAKGGAISTITPQLAQGSAVTVPRQDLDYVVTEYGVARVKGLSVKERVRALIRIAHPDFREMLAEEAERLGIAPGLKMSFAGARNMASSLERYGDFPVERELAASARN